MATERTAEAATFVRIPSERERDRLALLVESSDDAIISRDLDGTIRTWNRGAEKLFLYSKEEAIGRPISILYPPERALELSAVREGINHGIPVTHFRVSAVQKNGLRIEVSARSSVMTDDTGTVNGVSLIARDVSEQSKAEQALRRGEERLHRLRKMEAVGSLAGGIAHDFNNLLSVILGYTSLIADDLPPDAPIRADLAEVHKAGLRARDLTRQLLAFGRRQLLQPRVLDLNQVVIDMEQGLGRLLGDEIALSVLCLGEIGRVHADAGQLETVISSLVSNARDAMPRGGRLAIETGNVELDAEYAADHDSVIPGPYVMLAVTDTGTGMDHETIERIFDPFFTTKEQGKGTGLGLSTAYGIIQQSGGHVCVYSEPDRGTTFKIYFPRTERSPDTAILKRADGVELRGDETILLVEDEEQVRTVTRIILCKHGYKVLEACSGSEALLLFEQHASTVQLLLTDVTMPRMNGRELAERVTAIRPEIKVLYMSGYTMDETVHGHALAAGIAFLQKPATPDTLLRKVREVLAADQKPAFTPT